MGRYRTVDPKWRGSGCPHEPQYVRFLQQVGAEEPPGWACLRCGVRVEEDPDDPGATVLPFRPREA